MIQLSGTIHCYNIIQLFLTLLKPNKAGPNMGQSSAALTWSTVKLVNHFPFFFLPPQGTLGHSWQEAQIGFKAALSRLKNEPSNPEQMEFCVLFSCFLFPPLASPTLPLPCSAMKHVGVLGQCVRQHPGSSLGASQPPETNLRALCGVLGKKDSMKCF